VETAARALKIHLYGFFFTLHFHHLTKAIEHLLAAAIFSKR
jgi:hypothetical protein